MGAITFPIQGGMRILLIYSVIAIFTCIGLILSCNGDRTETCGTPYATTDGNIEGQVGDTVPLSCSATLPGEMKFSSCESEKVYLDFKWEHVSGPEVEIINSDQSESYFIPVETGEYRFCCKATYPITDVNKKVRVSSCAYLDVRIQ